MNRDRVLAWGGPAATLLAVILLWEIACRVLRVPEFVLPPPSRTLQALVEDWGTIWSNAGQTLFTTLVGFGAAVVLGVALGMLVGASWTLNRCLTPLLVAFNSVPKVALVPVLVLWFGIGSLPAICTALLLSFFPIAINVASGITTMEPELADVLRSLGATRTDILFKAGFPRALPHFFASLKVAITLAFVGSVISETVASNAGIGYLMIAASSSFRVPLVFASLLVIAALGVAMYAIAAWLEMRFAHWAFRDSPSGHAGGA